MDKHPMIELNWTLIINCIIGLFALSGFFRGWWKEAIMAFFLAVLVFLLWTPQAAQWLIDQINNRILRTLWSGFPASLQDYLMRWLGVDIVGFQIDASSAQTWLVILILLLGVAIILSRLLLPNHLRIGGGYDIYVVTPMGKILGGLLGGLNGFLIINLVREYLDGRNLPFGGGQPLREIAAAGDSVGIASSGVGLELIDLPGFVITNDVLSWLIVAFGVLLFFLVVNSRMNIRRMKMVKWPQGYVKTNITRKEEGVFTPTIVKR
jgi:hypothetical protein